MHRRILHARVGADGVLKIRVPMGEADANREVQVTIDPVGPPPMTQEQWQRFVQETAGSWQGELERPEQGDYERRDELP
jgi:hypothetical protein